MKLPHPIPYQGSKRNLADKILTYFPKTIDRLIEPFAGSAAITVAAAYHGKTTQFIINDVNEPLIKLWDKILNFPEATINEYQLILSYDGRTGEKQFGKPLPDFLALSKIVLRAGFLLNEKQVV